jgi:hypothetical protein
MKDPVKYPKSKKEYSCRVMKLDELTLACRKVISEVLSDDCWRSTWMTSRRLIIKYSKKLT